MDISVNTRRKLGATVVALAIAVLAAPRALADPPNYQRHLPQAHSGLTHEPEIIAGLVPSTPEGRPAPQPEIIDGIASPGYPVVSPVTQPSQRGFDWADAGIGAGVALAAAALAAGCTLALRRRVSLAH